MSLKTLSGAEEPKGARFLLHWVFCMKDVLFRWGSEEFERGGISKSQTLQTLVCVYFYDQFCPEK